MLALFKRLLPRTLSAGQRFGQPPLKLPIPPLHILNTGGESLKSALAATWLTRRRKRFAAIVLIGRAKNIFAVSIRQIVPLIRRNVVYQRFTISRVRRIKIELVNLVFRRQTQRSISGVTATSRNGPLTGASR